MFTARLFFALMPDFPAPIFGWPSWFDCACLWPPLLIFALVNASVPDHELGLCTCWFSSACSSVVLTHFCITGVKPPAGVSASSECFPASSLILYLSYLLPVTGPAVAWITSFTCPSIVLLPLQDPLPVSVGIYHQLILLACQLSFSFPFYSSAPDGEGEHSKTPLLTCTRVHPSHSSLQTVAGEMKNCKYPPGPCQSLSTMSCPYIIKNMLICWCLCL